MESAYNLDEKISLLNDDSSIEPIDLYITSVGGDVEAGRYIIDMITDPACAPVRAHAQGVVASIAAIIFVSASSKDVLPSSRLMIHQPLLAGPIKGNATDIRTISEDLLSTKNQLDLLLAKHTGRTIEEIREKTNVDSWFTAKEAVDFGLADRVSSYSEMMGFGGRQNERKK